MFRTLLRRMGTISKSPEQIVITGAKEHNLKVPKISIPKNQLVVITGVSGSGKSSLAFDTLYAEGQRRYVESLSAYARQFLGQMEKPKYEHISGLSPTIAIQQKASSANPRSTVGTATEIYDYLRVLWARVGKQQCHNCGSSVGASSSEEIVADLSSLPQDTKVIVLAPKVDNRKGEFKDLIKEAILAGFVRARIDGMMLRLEDVSQLEKNKKHTIEIVIDRLTIRKKDKGRLTDSVELALREGKGKLVCLLPGKKIPRVYSQYNMCTVCNTSFPDLSPQSFSFNSPLGMCVECNGLGDKKQVDPELLVPFPEKSIADGAIALWKDSVGKESGWTANIVSAVAKSSKISLTKPWNRLTERQRNVILHGSGSKRVKVEWQGAHSKGAWAMKFEGVIAQLERRYRDTKSERARKYYENYFRTIPCAACKGSRLRPESQAVTINKVALCDVTTMTVTEAAAWAKNIRLQGTQKKIAGEVLKEIRTRLSFLLSVGLNYLTLHRSSATLSGGESQRIRLASQLGSELSGVLYVLDEPSIGLHQRDNDRLIETLQRLRNLGNTVLVVEHDEATIRAADHVIDVGPGAGKHGGRIVGQGTPKDLLRAKESITGHFLSGKRVIPTPEKRRTADHWLQLTGASHNNLQNVDIKVPLGTFVAFTGVSGAGKSSLVTGTLHPALSKHLNNATGKVGAYKKLTGLEHVDKVIVIDQKPIGRTPRSNPATYTKAFDEIRQLFCQTPDAKVYGYTAGRFSFNVSARNGGGRCEACDGAGQIEVEMHFLPNVFVTCEVCRGHRYNEATLRVTYKGKSISDILAMPIEEAAAFFCHHKKLSRILSTLVDVGLGYIALGQSAITLSGGEAQRVKLARELAKRPTGSTLYFMDEPTTGLHFHDVDKLLEVLRRLVDRGNTVIVIEHNLDVIKTADWVIDVGPEGGSGGGKIVAAGTPEAVAKVKGSYTGRFLRKQLAADKAIQKSNSKTGRTTSRARNKTAKKTNTNIRKPAAKDSPAIVR